MQEVLDRRAAAREQQRRTNAARMARVAASLPAQRVPVRDVRLDKHEAPGMAIPEASTTFHSVGSVSGCCYDGTE